MVPDGRNERDPEARPRADARPARPSRKREAGALLGLGLDGDDGHRRITKGGDFLLYGGSQETHERMTDIVMRMRERLKRTGRSFGQLSAREFEDLGRDCL
jgi:hypothetical protein